MPDPNTYDIRINEMQRALLQRCVYHAMMTMPNYMWGEHEMAMAASMRDMLDPKGSTCPLSTTGVNSFVL